MEILQLSLTTKWFRKTESGEKTEDYREITPYWCNRLLLYNGKKESRIFWEKFLKNYGAENLKNAIQMEVPNKIISFRKFDLNVMTLGYPSNNNSDYKLTFIHDEIRIKTGIQEWGAEKGKIYFVIKHNLIL